MDTTVNISLNGYPYKLTEEAYRALRSYLDALIERFGQSNEAKETYEAIEARFGELLSERQKGNAPLDINAINEVINILGQPEDIDADQERKSASDRENAEETAERQRNSMGLYRDPDHKIISGVCAGLAARFGINTAAVRLLFCIAAFIYGIGIVVYVVLWAAVPAAYTPLQKLRMKGSPITINSIRTETNRNFQNSRNALTSKNQSNFLQSIGNLLTLIVLGLAKLIVKIIAFAFILSSAAGGIAITTALYIGLFRDAELSRFVFGDTSSTILSLLGWSSTPYIAAIAIWGICIVPLGFIFLLGMQMLTRFKIAKLVTVIAIVFWIVCLLVLSTLIPITKWKTTKHVSYYTEEYEIPMRANDTLRINMAENQNVDTPLIYLKKPNIYIRSTSDSIASVEISYKVIPYKNSPSSLPDEPYTPTIDTAKATFYAVPVSDEDHAPLLFNISIRIFVPEGTLLKVSPAAAKNAEAFGKNHILTKQPLSRKVWQMHDGKLRSPSSSMERTNYTSPTPANEKQTVDSIATEKTTAI